MANKHLKKAKKRQSPHEVIEALTDEKEKRSKFLTTVSSEDSELAKHYQVYMSSKDHTIRRQYQTECHFFDPKRSQKEMTYKLGRQFLKRRLKKSPSQKPYLSD